MTMKKTPRRNQGGRAAGIRTTAGKKSRLDRWLLRLSREVSAACDRFWLQTEERRLIERHRTRGFNPY